MAGVTPGQLLRSHSSRPLRRQLHFDEVITAWSRFIDLGRNVGAMIPHDRPKIGPERNQGEFPPSEILLIPDTLIACHKYIETRSFRFLE